MRLLLLEIMTGQCKVANMHSLNSKLIMNYTGKEQSFITYFFFNARLALVINLRRFINLCNDLYFLNITCIVTPPRCLVSDWIKGFKKYVWLKCAATNLFVTGFYRLNPPDNTSDPISLLEQSRCCSSIPEFSSQHGTCINADWWNSLAK